MFWLTSEINTPEMAKADRGGTANQGKFPQNAASPSKLSVVGRPIVHSQRAHGMKIQVGPPKSASTSTKTAAERLIIQTHAAQNFGSRTNHVRVGSLIGKAMPSSTNAPSFHTVSPMPRSKASLQAWRITSWPRFRTDMRHFGSLGLNVSSSLVFEG